MHQQKVNEEVVKMENSGEAAVGLATHALQSSIHSIKSKGSDKKSNDEDELVKAVKDAENERYSAVQKKSVKLESNVTNATNVTTPK